MSDHSAEIGTEPGLFNPTNLRASLGYIGLLGGFATAGLTAIAAVILAHNAAADAEGALYGHFRYQIRTFWPALIALVVLSVLTAVSPLGWLGLGLLGLWYVLRCANGLWLLRAGQGLPDPARWLL